MSCIIKHLVFCKKFQNQRAKNWELEPQIISDKSEEQSGVIFQPH